MDEKYTILGFDRFVDELLDKMGSDYFPLPIKFNRFTTIALDFIAETAVYEEVNQEVSDMIKPLRVDKILPLTIDEYLNQKRLICAEPINYFRLKSLVPYYSVSSESIIVKAREINIERIGNELANRSNPFKRPTEEYPEVTRANSIFYIYMGDEADLSRYNECLFSYIKKPTFASIENDNERIINLPDDSIEKIYLKTADALRYSTGDPGADRNYGFTQTFGKKNK